LIVCIFRVFLSCLDPQSHLMRWCYTSPDNRPALPEHTNAETCISGHRATGYIDALQLHRGSIQCSPKRNQGARDLRHHQPLARGLSGYLAVASFSLDSPLQLNPRCCSALVSELFVTVKRIRLLAMQGEGPINRIPDDVLRRVFLDVRDAGTGMTADCTCVCKKWKVRGYPCSEAHH
jgi:hypothetical protein